MGERHSKSGIPEAKAMDPFVHLLNDNPDLDIGRNSRKIWIAGLTTAKTMVVQCWKPPHDISLITWNYAQNESTTQDQKPDQ